MIRFGVIGTNFITKLMIEAGQEVADFELKAVYSRTKAKAQQFAEEYGADLTFTSVEEMAQCEEVDAIYIASPNSFHAGQAITAMKYGKHVLCEKPMASNQREAARMVETAKENNVLLMEAIKSTLMPGFASIQEHLHKIGKVRRYVGNFCKYSSRYDTYREGTVLNAFNPAFSNGSLMDLGVYGVYPMVVLFGNPKSLKANGVALASGVDGQGSILAEYEGMEAVVTHSKINHSYAFSEIQGEEGVIIIPNISEPKDIEIRFNDGAVNVLDRQDEFPPMYYELQEFISLAKEGKTQSAVNSYKNTLITSQILQEARRQMGISYPADQN
ncbi:Gfo/Idh/MocA family oxidoreductase [Halobacillus shinanisalinarum]|uniref:Gfo/Idh/MocA family oxidoreductase n=1 Tax=Halobacillus shinanisalinarum TaxID=2932258 RepID=A0ABY4H4W3_9BACI|nr:Gfo/Idh/MocA family oxidoreductase [Halobacillus shinanisalinarum]UOQ95341.1 Gfo/Idh/MocA family oxidoreductase [Halobacillus shinanisalinarum]